MSRRALALLAPLALLPGACVSTPEAAAPIARAEAPRFDPFVFFLGASRGEGTLDKVLSDPVTVRVESRGRIEIEPHHEASWDAADTRVLVLDQTVTEGDKRPRKRQWRLIEIAPGYYEGSLTDAIGKVTGRSEGNRLVLEYRMKGGFQVRQELTLWEDGRRAANVLKVSHLGVTVAVLAEEIVRG
ncbi:DUF3833 family protein [Erythrobacter dokdonensis]|uniref:DUF3833 domain-containing protein n=1 Tax=Erythrobacter dokdonensis DSW-74 TaxID=1300349 RepID=A0A1A7BGH1_9SPHN|nr:DUF3833 family protein [Erythrobacter dokdonensis]OBV11643.1 DUF3833 domain-containing protein [Erythrobacter dokdonensis DSW-74]